MNLSGMTKQEKLEWILDEVKKVVSDRGKERDLPDGERTIPRCVAAFNIITRHALSNEDGWLFMEVLKICRSTEGAHKLDDYFDDIGYTALRTAEAMEHQIEISTDAV